MMQTDQTDAACPDRRGGERRKAQVKELPFSDRRQGERRSGHDRRGAPRKETTFS